MKRVSVALVATAAAASLVLTACSSSTGGSSSSSSSSSSAPSSSSSSSSAASSSSSASSAASSAPSSAPSSAASASSGGSASSSGSSSAGGGGSDLTGTTLTVGSANFTENVILMDIYADALKAKGATVNLKPKIGSREAYIPALKDGSIDLIPEYSGNLLAYFDKTATAASAADVFKALPTAIGADLKVLQYSAAEDKDSITVTQDTATKYNLKTIADLQSHAADLTVGAAPEFKTRKDGIPGLKSVYDVTFGTFKPLDASVLPDSLKNGQIDAADIYTTDASIAANKFVALEDPKNLYVAQNVLPLISAKKSTPGVESVLNAISAKLTTADLLDLNATVASGTDPDKAAQDWLKSKGLS